MIEPKLLLLSHFGPYQMPSSELLIFLPVLGTVSNSW